ncbi:inner membrane transporter RhtA [Paraburkholderia kururiensis]|uniref:EamA family transporter n=1 Tax=Paraburkholderia kururiensis TaxID=984307 RepID=UPI0039A62AE3
MTPQATESASPRLAGPALATGSMISVQLGSALSEPLMAAHGSAAVTASRLVCAALVLLLLARPRLLRLTGAQWRAALALGTAMAGLTLCYFEAVLRIPLGAAATIGFLGPLAVAATALRGWPRFALPVLAGAGVLAMSTGSAHGPLDPAGMLLACGAALGWGAYIVLTRRVGQLFSQQEGLALSLAVAAVVALPVARTLDPAGLPAALWPSAAGLALLVPLLPYSLEMMALRRMNMGAFSVLMSLEPAIGAALGFVVLHERLSATQLLGMLAVMAASVAAVRLTAQGRAEA